MEAVLDAVLVAHLDVKIAVRLVVLAVLDVVLDAAVGVNLIAQVVRLVQVIAILSAEVTALVLVRNRVREHVIVVKELAQVVVRDAEALVLTDAVLVALAVV